jgi:hypothetical protein
MGDPEVSIHDPRQFIEDLRNHLAAHDRRLAFLFGAGTSSAVNAAPSQSPGKKPKHCPLIPGIVGLTERCAEVVGKLGEPHAKAWAVLVNQCEQRDGNAYIESILSNVRMKIDAMGAEETLVGLDRDQLQKIETAICGSIATTTFPAEDKIPIHTPHDDLSAWVRKINRAAPLEVFTTNYDILFERSFEASKIPIFDGFVGAYRPFFYPECLEDDQLLPGARWVRLWKLHGSVNWHREEGPSGKRIIRTEPSTNGEMILPSYLKYDESRKLPYLSYMERLGRVLNAEHSLLITCGYSFGDAHINAILYNALENRNTANIVALQYLELGESDDLVIAAIRQPNLTIIGPNAGVISGTFGLWRLTEPVDNKMCGFMDSAFDSNALPEDAGSSAVSSEDLNGRMRLGDFNWFCRFLKEMGPDIP